MDKEQIADIVREHFTAAYVCNRVWEAWSYNTMGPNDFIEASETEMADEIAAAVFERFSQPAMPADAEDAMRYRWLKANIQKDYELPGGYYIPDEDTHSWDKTIDAARRRIEGESHG